MRVIIKTRELTLKDLQFARMLKPFEDANLVHTLPDRVSEVEFLSNIMSDHRVESCNFEHVLIKTNKNMLPSEIYYHLTQRDSYIPTLYIANYDGDKYYNIKKLTRHQELQSLLSVLSSRGLVEEVTRLL